METLCGARYRPFQFLLHEIRCDGLAVDRDADQRPVDDDGHRAAASFPDVYLILPASLRLLLEIERQRHREETGVADEPYGAITGNPDPRDREQSADADLLRPRVVAEANQHRGGESVHIAPRGLQRREISMHRGEVSSPVERHGNGIRDAEVEAGSQRRHAEYARDLRPFEQGFPAAHREAISGRGVSLDAP